jgi:hypothetical protein
LLLICGISAVVVKRSCSWQRHGAGEGEFGWLAEVGNELKGCRDYGVAMVELSEIAARLADEQKLKLKYRNLITVNGRAKWVVRTDRLLDVDEEQGILYVERDGQPAWVKVEEAIRVTRHRAKG